ncbi:MAG: hypothetical protein A2161_01010 [Candidatus Schekmanbacteria bacterium RBG_13_48_7]|uniref:DUF5723 domain-containing protein n=1 Tax=Candidatus Schekmanbacteria bacterium RBG_13_48_7 TaxID=1817878 RepID=A0A1F7S0Z3_9BACT|nr:MAG: hypothetical protein A2161_01010 [Candidatus Schekmanbacteria bacterium RBG_13_48_7]
MIKKIIWYGVIFLLGFPCLECSATSFDYTSGLIDIPIAEVIPHLDFAMSLNVSMFEETSDGGVQEEGAKLNFGLYDRIEFGITGLVVGNGPGNEKIVVGNFSSLILKEKKTVPAFAVGVHNMSSEETCYYRGTLDPGVGKQNFSIFGVGSKTILKKSELLEVKGHIGVGNHKFAKSGDDIGVFGGINANICLFKSNHRPAKHRVEPQFSSLSQDPENEIQDSSNQLQKNAIIGLMFEYDGRSVNAGLQYIHNWLGFHFAVADIYTSNAKNGYLEYIKYNFAISINAPIPQL